MKHTVAGTAIADGPEQPAEQPTFRLPEAFRETVRLYLEELDTEWMLRHPDCERLERDSFDADRKWGERCRACFSPVTAEELTGKIERALTLYRQHVESATAHPEDPIKVLADLAGRTEILAAGFDRAAANAWPFLFAARTELATARQALAALPPLLAAAAADFHALAARKPNGEENAAGSERPLQLAWLLAGILQRGGLPCIVAHLPEADLRSPGVEILVAALDQVGIRLSPAVLTRICSEEVTVADAASGREKR